MALHDSPDAHAHMHASKHAHARTDISQVCVRASVYDVIGAHLLATTCIKQFRAAKAARRASDAAPAQCVFSVAPQHSVSTALSECRATSFRLYALEVSSATSSAARQLPTRPANTSGFEHRRCSAC